MKDTQTKDKKNLAIEPAAICWNLNISFYPVAVHGWDLDIKDLSIFSLMVQFCSKPSCNKLQEGQDLYYEFAPAWVLSQLPYLGISSTRAIRVRYNKLVAAKLIEAHPESERLGKALYKFGVNRKKYDGGDHSFHPDHNTDQAPESNVRGQVKPLNLTSGTPESNVMGHAKPLNLTSGVGLEKVNPNSSGKNFNDTENQGFNKGNGENPTCTPCIYIQGTPESNFRHTKSVYNNSNNYSNNTHNSLNKKVDEKVKLSDEEILKQKLDDEKLKRFDFRGGAPVSLADTAAKENYPEYITDVEKFLAKFWKLYDFNMTSQKDKCLMASLSLTYDERVACLERVPLHVKCTPEKRYRGKPLAYLQEKRFLDELVDRRSKKQKAEDEISARGNGALSQDPEVLRMNEQRRQARAKAEALRQQKAAEALRKWEEQNKKAS